jgi:hypothetical protein
MARKVRYCRVSEAESFAWLAAADLPLEEWPEGPRRDA